MVQKKVIRLTLNQGKTMSELETEIQASTAEILSHLKQCGAFEYKGRWVTLASEAEFNILIEVTTLIRAEGYLFLTEFHSSCTQLGF